MRRIAAVMALIGAVVARAEAQNPAGTFDPLRVLVDPGDTLTLTDRAGQRVRGKLAELTNSSLVLTVGGTPRQFDITHVSTITKRGADSLKNGAVIGMCVTGAILAGGLASAGIRREERGQVFVAALAYSAVGAAVGAGLDALVPSDRVISPGRGEQTSRSHLCSQRRASSWPCVWHDELRLSDHGRGKLLSRGF